MRTTIILALIAGGVVAAVLLRRARISQEALLESEEHYRAFFNSTNDGILILDSEGKILEINEALCLRLQYSREELLGKGVGDIDPPEFAKLVPERVRAVLQSGSAVFETAHLRRDGTPIPTEISARAITYRGSAALLSLARDITERKQTEKALRGAEELYRNLVENLGEGVCIVDQGETFLFANPAGEAIFGVPPDSLAGRNLREFMSDEAFERAREGTRQRQQAITSKYESHILRPDGSSGSSR